MRVHSSNKWFKCNAYNTSISWVKEGDEITITGAETIIECHVTAYNLNVTTKITKIIDETYYNIEPTLDDTPNSTTCGGGAFVKLEYRPDHRYKYKCDSYNNITNK